MSSTSTSPELVRTVAPATRRPSLSLLRSSWDRAVARLRPRDWLGQGLIAAAWIVSLPALWLILSLGHEVLVLASAGLLRWASSWGWIPLAIQIMPVNFIYASAIVRYVGEIQPVGLAIGGDLGVLAESLLPTVFYDPSFVAGDGPVSAVVGPGSALLARTLATAIANITLLVAGIGLVARGLRGAHVRCLSDVAGWRLAYLAAGALIQVEVTARVLRTPGSSRDLEELGVLPFITHEILRLHGETYDLLLSRLTRYVDPVFTVLVLAGLYGIVAAAWWLQNRWRDWHPQMLFRAVRLPREARGWRSETHVRVVDPSARLVVDASLAAVLIAALPVFDLVRAQTRFLEWSLDRPTAAVAPSAVDDAAAPVVYTAAPVADLPHASESVESAPVVPGVAAAEALAPVASVGDLVAPDPALEPRPVPRPELPTVVGPSVVGIGGRGMRFVYVVDGVPTEVRGMGYNVTHHGLPPKERTAKLARDFATMREYGVNTVVGWRSVEWDEEVLNAAHANGVGVVLPYDLDDRLDYADRGIRFRVRSDVLAWVARYRHHPAVRMWGIGNESLLHLRQAARARAFAEFYVGLVEAVRDLDPTHPVLYREAEDVYARWLADAWIARGGPPHGFVMGMNFYTFRMRDALAEWPKRGMDVPLLVSEFAPAGVGRGERPAGFTRMWSMIRARPDTVLGAAPYVWSTEGPEPVDRLFGLTDGSGKPVDASLGALRDAYLSPRPIDSTTAPSLLGLRVDQAQAVIRGLGLEVGAVTYQRADQLADQALHRRYGVGHVMHQEPAAGVPIERGAAVRIAVASAPSQPALRAKPQPL